MARQGAYLANVSATADAAGEWACLLPAMPATVSVRGASTSYSLTASLDKTSQTQQLSDVVWGDVFVCSGQSNMELPLSLVNNHTLELAAAAAFPWIRVAVVGGGCSSDSARSTPSACSSDTPLRDTPTPLLLPWQRASPSALGRDNNRSWGYFSATCWLTARNVAQKLGPSVPLGLIGAYVSGTPVESWTPGLNPAEIDPQGHKSAVLYNAMIAPLSGMMIRCILWYQGENNSYRGGNPERWIKYATDFPLMIKRWREAWVNNSGQSALAHTPFGFVQIGPRDCTPDVDGQGHSTGAAEFYGGVRWAQTAFHYAVPNDKMPHVFMAVAADLAEGYSPVLDLREGCVHFGDKQDVGRRLALGVGKYVYGDDVSDAGPMVASIELVAQAAALLTVRFGTAAGPIEVRSSLLCQHRARSLRLCQHRTRSCASTTLTPVLTPPHSCCASTTLTPAFAQVRNTSGFEVSSNGKDYVAAPITAHDESSVTLRVPPGLGIPSAAAVVSLRYILHDTPCINQSCAVYASEGMRLPSPPLVANLPGHAGADAVGWNMTKT